MGLSAITVEAHGGPGLDSMDHEAKQLGSMAMDDDGKATMGKRLGYYPAGVVLCGSDTSQPEVKKKEAQYYIVHP